MPQESTFAHGHLHLTPGAVVCISAYVAINVVLNCQQRLKNYTFLSAQLSVMMHLVQSRLFVEGGVNKIRLTGGEPTLRRDIVDLTKELNALPGLQAIGITTNGIALRRKLPELQAHGMRLRECFISICLHK